MMMDSSVRILLVEDEDAHAIMIQRAFDSLSDSPEVVHVRDLADARVALSEGPAFHLVISDLILPDGQGTELVSEVHASADIGPLIIMTSHGDEHAAVMAIKAGALDYVVKSDVTFADMPHIAHRAMREWRLLDERRESEEREKDLQRRLAHAERLESLGTLAGGVSHDLNNILSPMLALPELMQQDVLEVYTGNASSLERMKDDLTGLVHSAKRAAAVIHDLMTLSRGSNYERVPVDINTAIREFMVAGECLAGAGSMKNISLETDLSEPLPAVLGSTDHLIRVVSNLITNACDASHASGAVRVTTHSEELDEDVMGYESIPAGTYVVVAVEDAGRGIAMADLSKIFEPFYTKKVQTATSGTGLGLSVVHGIVKDHDGYVHVESVVGEGTTFRVYFPAVQGDVAAPTPLTVPTGSERVLVVDDDDAQRRTCRRVLRNLGYEVDLARDGQSAVELYQLLVDGLHGAPYDLLLVDMIMRDGFDGLDTLAAITDLFPNQKAIIVSGYAPDERARDAVRHGVPWIAKPYEVGDLARIVRTVLDDD